MADTTMHAMARFTVKRGMGDAFTSLMDEIREPTRAEPGCLGYHLLRSRDDPARFVFVEQWRGEEDLARHLAAPHVEAVAARLQAILACPPTVYRYTSIW